MPEGRNVALEIGRFAPQVFTGHSVSECVPGDRHMLELTREQTGFDFPVYFFWLVPFKCRVTCSSFSQDRNSATLQLSVAARC